MTDPPDPATGDIGAVQFNDNFWTAFRGALGVAGACTFFDEAKDPPLA